MAARVRSALPTLGTGCGFTRSLVDDDFMDDKPSEFSDIASVLVLDPQHVKRMAKMAQVPPIWGGGLRSLHSRFAGKIRAIVDHDRPRFSRFASAPVLRTCVGTRRISH